MKKITFPLFVFAGALCALQAQADDKKIDWNLVPGGRHGRNDVTRDFVTTPDPLNVILSNSFTAWDPDQKIIAQAQTTTGRDQRQAVLGNPNAPVAASNVSYTSETVVTTQAAPSAESSQASQGNQPVYSEGATTGSAAGAQTQSQMNQAQQNVRSSGESASNVNPEAKAKLAPHTLMIESSLSSAMDQVRGLKGEMGVAEGMKAADQNTIQSYNAFVKEMNNDLKVARTHVKQLKSDVRSYPDIANSDEYRNMSPAFQDLHKTLSSWEGKACNAKYWNNQQQAMADIDKLEKQLGNALNKVKNFSSSQLNASLS